MDIDFTKLVVTSLADSSENPRDIFGALPHKKSKYSYLRDVQGEVLNRWFAARSQKDIRIKMNTGSGKTVVGLLLLKSCLNEGIGPAVYIAPSPYLATQVVQEAAALGLLVDQDPRSTDVLRGKAILVTSIYVLLNGMSKFGVGHVSIPIGSLVLDDAHACLATAEQQFTLTIEASNAVYKKLLDLFKVELTEQSSGGFLEIQNQDPYKSMQVPFWAWQSKIQKVEELLYAASADDDIKFTWPLVKDHLILCRCAFGNGVVEISPPCLPVSVIPSFTEAKRRIFMSATFSDDSILVTHFDVNPNDIRNAVTPDNASDLGDRMILIPQALNPKISDSEIKDMLAERSKKYNVVVIVPSNPRAAYWKDIADVVAKADELESAVESLRKHHVGLTVLVNRYDGIDLPGDACRILVLDGLPDVRRQIDRLEEPCLQGTGLALGRAMQQLEQGMGRGVRANDDYCVVILMGRSLIGNIYNNGGVTRLTPATRAQFELSEKLGEQAKGKTLAEIGSMMDYSLQRRDAWVTTAKNALVGMTYQADSTDLNLSVARRNAYDFACIGDPKAPSFIQAAIDKETDSKVRGWLMMEYAAYTNLSNAVEAQKLLFAARRENRHIPVRPQSGIDYVRLKPLVGEQASASLNFIRSAFSSGNELMVAAHAVASELAFQPDSYRRFEKALCDAANILGFVAEQPETQFGAGPDVLWAVGGLRYFVIECKNEATSDTMTKGYVNQLAGSCNWFVEKFDDTCKHFPIEVHPSPYYDQAATPPAGMKVMTADKLNGFRDAFLDYCVSLTAYISVGDQSNVASLLSQYKLTPEQIVNYFTVLPLRRR